MTESVKGNKNILEFTSASGKKYTFQKVKPSSWLAIMDEVAESNGRSNSLMYGKILDNVVVKPKLTLDDFEDFAELEEVVKSALTFQRGK